MTTTMITPAEFERYAAAVTALATRFMSPTYGYNLNEAFVSAARTLEIADARGWLDDVIADALDEATSCENCPRIAVANHRCAKCQHLPSDDI